MRSHLMHLEDIVEAIDVIKEIAAEGTAAELALKRRDRGAFERNFEILAEATKHLSGGFKDQHPEIPWRKIVDLGNLLRHEYARVEIPILHTIVDTELPAFEEACRAELQRLLRP